MEISEHQIRYMMCETDVYELIEVGYEYINCEITKESMFIKVYPLKIKYRKLCENMIVHLLLSIYMHHDPRRLSGLNHCFKFRIFIAYNSQ